MSDVLDALKTVGGVVAKVAWEGAKLGYQTGKITGEIVKETAKGALKGLETVGKEIIK